MVEDVWGVCSGVQLFFLSQSRGGVFTEVEGMRGCLRHGLVLVGSKKMSIRNNDFVLIKSYNFSIHNTFYFNFLSSCNS